MNPNEYGRIAEDGVNYERLESVEEEYLDEGERVEYRNAETQEVLSYTSVDDFANKYISNAKQVILDFIKM